MSRLGKRRLNCASEEEGMAAVQRRKEQHQQQQPMAQIVGGIGNQQPQFSDANQNQQICSYFTGANYLASNGCQFPPSEYSTILDNGPAYLVQQPSQFAILSPSSSPYNHHHHQQQQQQQQQQSIGNYYSTGISSSMQCEILNSGVPMFAPNSQHLVVVGDLNGKQEKIKSNGQKGGGEEETPPTQMLNMNANLCQMPIFLQSRSPFETFCTVPGRTSLLSSTTKYKVTVGEIQRRINPPECLNASLIGGILRKAKSKDGGKALRESLKRIGLSLPAGRRKSACLTAFTALVEEEAVHLANDFHLVLQREFPVKDTAIFLNSQFLHYFGQPIDGELVNRRRTFLNCARSFVKEICDLVSADRSPICDRRPELFLEPNIQKPLTHFSLITHGFGGIAILAVLEMLNICIGESMKNLDKMLNENAQMGFEQNNSTIESSSTLQNNANFGDRKKTF